MITHYARNTLVQLFQLIFFFFYWYNNPKRLNMFELTNNIFFFCWTGTFVRLFSLNICEFLVNWKEKQCEHKFDFQWMNDDGGKDSIFIDTLLFYLNKLRWKICRLLNATRYTQGLCPTYTQMRRVFGHHISCGWISCDHFQRFIADNWTLSTPKSISVISSVRPDLNSSSTAVACLENKMERFLFDLPIWLHQPEV